MKTYRFGTLLFILYLCFAGFSGYAQAPSWNWVSHNNLGSREDAEVVTDPAGYIYAGGQDSIGYVLTKYKPSGSLIWSKRFPNTLKLSADTAGNLYLTGNAFLFFYTSKLDSAGTVQWTKGISYLILPADGYTASLSAAAADSSGNTYMSGTFKPRATFDTIALSNLAPLNHFIAKYNAAGKIQWLRLLNDEIVAITCGPQGSYFVQADFYIQKYSANGTLIWQQGISGSFNRPNKLRADAQGNLFVFGTIVNNTTFGSITLPTTGISNLALVKYNSNGNLAWARTNQNLTPDGEFEANDISLTSAGEVLLTGNFSENATLGNGTPMLTAGTHFKNLFIAQFSGIDGSALWVKQLGSAGTDAGQAIHSLPNGNCLVAGNFNTGSTFGNLSVPGKGFFLGKLSANMLGVSENAGASTFRLFPNPATAEATIFNPEFKEGAITVFNATGQKMHEAATARHSSITLQTENWPAGIYLVKLVSAETTATQKLIVTH